MPTNIAVTIFKPIWKFHTAPIKFIININSPPKTEFIINLNNAFNGTENIFPIIHKTTIHPKITKALEKSNFYHHSFSNMYDKNWTNITYPTWFFLKYISSIMSKDKPFALALFTKKSTLLLFAFIWYV